MWHAGKKVTEEEKVVLRELEYDLFMCNPGFRSMWDNNFEAYFEALFDKAKWDEREEQRDQEIHQDMGIRMIEDPEYYQFLKEQAIMDEVMSGEMKIENAPVEMQEELRDMMAEMEGESNFDERDLVLDSLLNGGPSIFKDEEEKDELLVLAKQWAFDICKVSGGLYEKTRDINLFRIETNCFTVSGKIVGALAIDYDERDPDYYDFEWRLDRIDYNLSLTSLLRCLESLEKLRADEKIFRELDGEKFIKQGKVIKQELMDRLDKIEQLRFIKSIKAK